MVVFFSKILHWEFEDQQISWRYMNDILYFL